MTNAEDAATDIHAEQIITLNASELSLAEPFYHWRKKSPPGGMYIASMDHSPSEQLDGHDWHTTVIVLSPGFEHAQLAKTLGASLKPKNPSLSKWSKASDAYKNRFAPEFVRELQQYPSVAVLAVSAREVSIWKELPNLISALQIEQHFKRIDHGRVRFGPFTSINGEGAQQEINLVISEKRAAMCLFIAHFIRRMQIDMFAGAIMENPASPELINWNFYGDKFPGPPNEDMDLMFKILMGIDQRYGRILWGYFKNGREVQVSYLPDNLAGALNANAFSSVSFSKEGGLFYWEQIEPIEGAVVGT